MRRLILLSWIATAVAVASPAGQTPAKHFLWTVVSPNAPPSYLMGSVHVLTPDYYPLPARVEEAFRTSKVLIEELDLDEMTNPATVAALMAQALLSDGRTLDQVISAELYARVSARADTAGVPLIVLRRMKPWMAALAVMQPTLQAAGFKAEHGIDKHFFDRAKSAGMPRRALETAAFQFGRMDQLSAAQQETMLRSTLDDLESQITNVKTIVDAWSRGDVAALEKELLAPMITTPDLYQRLLVERNAAWVSSVEDCVKEKTSCFVVVGAAHLVGPDSLVAMLQKKGYKVEQQ